MKLIVLGIALGLAGAPPVEAQEACSPGSRPWQVSLDGGCSGALISQWWLVTSLLCSPRPHSSIASLGSVSEEQHIQVADVIFHSPYRSPMHSLAMPIPLPTRCTRPGESCRVSGWGRTNSSPGDKPLELQCMDVPVVDDQTCMNNLPEYIFWSYGMVCAGSHGPGQCMVGESWGSSVMECGGQLQGLAWFPQGCAAPPRPSVYTKMCGYTSWIRGVMDRYASSHTTALPPTTGFGLH
ncbi:hypothetical protein NHX12_001010 [Muraenolepis orangiensis]|uniref:Peptidase S1 domain-containing protein n=1 Tax=Muraenolepis orangiensis TaxID=630683 RepID=A0A9Q0DZ57_9TELE|nr:hypothetical protein NHX12_001010 [Muraenolepis orangiensis]